MGISTRHGVRGCAVQKVVVRAWRLVLGMLVSVVDVRSRPACGEAEARRGCVLWDTR